MFSLIISIVFGAESSWEGLTNEEVRLCFPLPTQTQTGISSLDWVRPSLVKAHSRFGFLGSFAGRAGQALKLLLFAFLFCLCQLDVSWSRLGKGKAIGDLPPSDWLVASLWSFQNHDWYGRARPIVSGDILGQYLKKRIWERGNHLERIWKIKIFFKKKHGSLGSGGAHLHTQHQEGRVG